MTHSDYLELEGGLAEAYQKKHLAAHQRKSTVLMIMHKRFAGTISSEQIVHVLDNSKGKRSGSYFKRIGQFYTPKVN